MRSAPISPIDRDDRDAAITTVVAAFAEDPVERWLYPEEEQYELHFPDFVAAFGGRAFDQATGWCLAGVSAVALWLPPEVEADEEAVVAVLSNSVASSKHEELFSVLEQMGNVHPTFPHWYLPWLGVEPVRQGQGLGAALLEHCLTIVDASGLPAFLETPNPRTIDFYERHRFEVIATTQATSCPPMTSMIRAQIPSG